jgi:hypothetical protein
MRIAIMGTDGSLKRAAARNVASLLRIPYEDTVPEDVQRITGASKCHQARPGELFSVLDGMMQDHQRRAEGVRSAVFPVTTVEILSYHLLFCAGYSDPNVSRNAIINCAKFTMNYDHLFLITLEKETHDAEEESFFAGNIAQEYAMEYMMRGVIGRFGLNYWEIKEKTVEATVNEIIDKV